MASAKTEKQSEITQATKVAAIMIALGVDSASEVYKYLRDDEIEAITSEIAKLDLLSSDDMQQILEDFYDLCVTQKVVAEGGESYAKDVLDKAFGPQRASYLMDQVLKSNKTRNFDFLRKVAFKNLLMMLQNEHPQMNANVLS